jgi:MFS family permease
MDREAPGAGASMRTNVEEVGLRRIIVVAAVMCAALMQTLDSTIVNVATIWQAGITTSTNSFSSFVLPLVLQGVGSGMLFVPLLFSVLGSLRDGRDSSSVSAFVNMIAGAHGVTQAAGAQFSLLVEQQAAAFADADVFLLVALLTLLSVPLILGIPKPTTTDVVIEVG